VPVFSFVGLAEDPQVLAIRAPELFGVGRCHSISRCPVVSRLTWFRALFSQMIASTYPRVVQGVN
jgi:hypothetical protein